MIEQRCIEGWENSRTVDIDSRNISLPKLGKYLPQLWYCQRPCWQLAMAVALGISSALILLGNRALAQSNIVPDNTLGAGENSIVIPNLNGLPLEVIAGGAQREQNLFHSFLEFNIDVGRGAYFFSGDAAIQNILARVTGVNPSEILGTLGTFGDSQPNLFLINPNGIIFGEDSKLDVGGSFVATTANAIGLGDTGRFSASEPNTSNLLNINPDVFFLNRLSNQAQIVNRSTAITPVLGDFINGLPLESGLQLLEGKSLLLLGGDVNLDGGVLQAPGGRVELGGLSEAGTVELNADGNNLSLSFPDDVARANVSLTNGAQILAAAGGGGSIVINAQTVDILEGSVLVTGIATGLGAVDSKAGDIAINATGTVTISELSFISNSVLGIGNGGDIEITTGSLEIINGAGLSASTFGQGNAGGVKISATDKVLFDGVGSNGLSSGVGSTVQAGAVGDGGDLEITTGSLEVTNGAILTTSILGEGNAGNIEITATDRVRFDGVGTNLLSSGAFSTVEAGAVGNGGEINIIAGSLDVVNGAFLSATTVGEGNAGNIKITATDRVSFDGVGSNLLSSGAFSRVVAGAKGDAGDLEITAGSLEVTNGATLTASTLAEGNAGKIKIAATDRVWFDGVGSNGLSSEVSSNVATGAVGEGGKIEIITDFLEVTSGAILTASIFGEGNAEGIKITATDRVRFDGVGSNGLSSSALSVVTPGAVGDGGDIEIITDSLEVTNGAGLFASTFGQGNAGNIKVTATDRVWFDGVGSNGLSSEVSSNVATGAVGEGGKIEIITDFLEVTSGAILTASIFGEGNAEGIKITATDRVRFDGVGSNGLSSSALSVVTPGAVGDGGEIEIITGSLEVTNGAGLFASTFGQGNAGRMKITARDTVLFDGVGSNGVPGGAFSSVGTGVMGDGGDIEINTGSLEVTNGASLNASTLGEGNAGSVRIRASDTVRFDGVGSNGESSFVSSSVEAGAVGKGGDIEINAGSLEVTNGAFLSTITSGEGNAGGVKITARDTVLFDGSSSSASSAVAAGAVGNGGDIEITTGSLEITNGALLNTSTLGEGDAGGVKITATDTVRFHGVGSDGLSSGVFSQVLAGAMGDGTDIEINTGSLEVTNGAILTAITVGDGDAGDVRINARDTVLFDGVGTNGLSSGAGSTVQPGAVGTGGDIEITTGTLEVTNGALLTASTFGEGNAGSVRIRARDRVRFDGVGSNGESSGAFSTVEAGAMGNSGNQEITTGSLEVTNGAFLSATTVGEGNAGGITITATDGIRFDGVGSNGLSSGAFSRVVAGAKGDGGDLEFTTGSLEITNGAVVSTSTLGEGDAGDVKITAADTVLLDRGEVFSSVEPGAIGTGGDIEITTGSLSLTDALISSESKGTGVAGNITINTRQNLETNRSSISATTLSGDGGDITLRVGNLLLLRDNSKISTTAGQAGAGGDGGNISIDAEFVIGVPREDSDITANAFNGRGGNITITTQGIFGLQFRDRLTPLSDITASSEFGLDGQFILNLLFPIDVTQGLSELPIEPVTSELNQSCQAGGSQSAGSFINTGRGGLPPEPTEPLDSSDLWEDVQLPRKISTDGANIPTTPSGQIVEAQGWIVNQEGHIELVAQLPTTTSDWGCSLH